MTVRKGSPWISQMERQRPAASLDGNESADTVVVGGGIAGLATAFYVLRDTDREVVLLEADLVAHGATGHSAGQAVAAMERRFDDTSGEMGEESVAQGYREIQSGWERLEEVLDSTGRQVDLIRVRGVAAVDSTEAAASILDEREKWNAAGAARTEVAVSSEIGVAQGTRTIDHRRLASLLGTIDRRYVAAICAPSGVLNAALLTEAMAEHLLSRYPDRFRLYERSRVRRLRLGDEIAASTDDGTVFADNAVLCTNGYTGMEIESCQVPVSVGNVKGVIGFMVGRFGNGQPGTAAFFRSAENGYYYMTRRPYHGRMLVAVGGPEKELPPGERYDAQREYDADAYRRIDAFARETLEGYNERDMEWHGLMGYTPGGIRLVGPDPGVPSLMYNLGCNGIGLLASLAGGWKVAQQMRGTLFPPSMFDPSRLARDRLVRLV